MRGLKNGGGGGSRTRVRSISDSGPTCFFSIINSNSGRDQPLKKSSSSNWLFFVPYLNRWLFESGLSLSNTPKMFTENPHRGRLKQLLRKRNGRYCLRLFILNCQGRISPACTTTSKVYPVETVAPPYLAAAFTFTWAAFAAIAFTWHSMSPLSINILYANHTTWT